MSKTIDNIKCGNYEVVDNQGISVTRHFTQCLEKEFADLEAKLAESEEKNLLLYSILYETLEKEYSENVSSRINQMTGETLEKQSEWFKSNRIGDELQKQLAEKERQYETLYKLFSEQHEIIDQNELECFEEVNRLLKEQKDFYIVEKAEYDKMKQGAKDIVKDLKQKLEEKDVDLSLARNEIDTLKHNLKVAQEHDNIMCEQYFEKCKKTNQDKISFTIEQLEKVKEHFINIKTPTLGVIRRAEMVMYIDNQIKQLKEGN